MSAGRKKKKGSVLRVQGGRAMLTFDYANYAYPTIEPTGKHILVVTPSQYSASQTAWTFEKKTTTEVDLPQDVAESIGLGGVTLLSASVDRLDVAFGRCGLALTRSSIEPCVVNTFGLHAPQPSATDGEASNICPLLPRTRLASSLDEYSSTDSLEQVAGR